jgi:hypothetical protein
MESGIRSKSTLGEWALCHNQYTKALLLNSIRGDSGALSLA